ncbi:MAG: hypothetical protein IKW85_09925 [Muribaculaceae bacterium]|nr:hypothetical protein [Muribaculaceae bacterium]
MKETLQTLKDFFDNPYIWATLAILGFFGITDWAKNLVLQYLKETGHNFKELINDKALRSSFYKWSGKHYKQLPPWAKRLSRKVENVVNKMGFRTRRRGGRRKTVSKKKL